MKVEQRLSIALSFSLSLSLCKEIDSFFLAVCPMVKEEMHSQENTLYDLDLVVKVTQNVVQYSSNHMTYAPTKFEVATSNSLGKDGFTRKYII